MSEVTEIIKVLKKDWSQPRQATHRGKPCPFLLACNFSPLASEAVEQFPFSLPDEVREFWLTAGNATLFKDQQYGQWGIEMLEPAEALSETRRQTTMRSHDFDESDLILGRFFGDADLIVVSCNHQREDFGSVRIALPIDKRNAWPTAANSLAQFLKHLLNAQGDKYWEVSST